MLYGVLCVVACVVLVRFIVYHVKDVLVCFGDSSCDAASHVLCVVCVVLSGVIACVCDCGVCVLLLCFCVLFVSDCVMVYGVLLLGW